MPRTLSSVAALGCLLLPSAVAAAAAVAVDADPIEAARDEASSFFGRRLQFDVASLPEEEPVPVADEDERFGVAPAPIEEDGEDETEGEGKKKHKRMKNHNKKTKRQEQKTKRKHREHKRAKGSKGSKSVTKEAPSTLAAVEGDTLCSCSPTSYSFALNFDGKCDDTVGFDGPGLEGSLCQFTRGTNPNDMNIDAIGLGGTRKLLRGESRRRWDAVLSQVDFSSHEAHAKRAFEAKVKANRSAGRRLQILDTTPVTVTSVTFLEADTSPQLNIINQDSTYFDTTLSDEETIVFDSVSAQLDADTPLDEQLNLFPGGVFLVLFGTNAEGTVIQNTVAWGYDTGYCAGEIFPNAMDTGEKIGWIWGSDYARPNASFCPGTVASTKAPSSSPTMPPTIRAASKSSKKKRGKAGKGAKSGSISMSMHSGKAGKEMSMSMHSGKAGKGMMSMTPSPTPGPTPAPSPETIAPTSVPDGAEYFTGFERGSLDLYQEWFSVPSGTGLKWEPTKAMPKDGVFAMQAPNLDTPGRQRDASILQTVTGPNWPLGKLYYSIVPGVEMPIDKVEVQVCGSGGVQCGVRDVFTSNSDTYEERFLQLPAGENFIAWFYLYNPEGFPPSELPPDGALERSGVFIDNVYFVPDDVTPPPPTPPPSGPPADCVALDPNPYNFENQGFPEAPWSLSGAGEWFRTTGDAVTGLHFMQSPVFDVSEASGTVMANATLQVCEDFTGGQVSMYVKTTALPPLDYLVLCVDGCVNESEKRQLADVEEWTLVALPLDAGPHRIDISYQYNPFSIPPSALPDRPLGVAQIDDVALQSNPSATYQG